MTELTNIWMEMGSYNRYAETKLAFFIGLIVAVISVVNSSVGQSFGPIFVLRGGNAAIMNFAASVSLAFSLFGVLPDLRSKPIGRWFIPKRQSDNVYYFQSIASYSSATSWLAATGIAVANDEMSRARMLADQIYVVARITSRKFHLMQYALFTLCAGWLLSWLPSLSAPAG